MLTAEIFACRQKEDETTEEFGKRIKRLYSELKQIYESNNDRYHREALLQELEQNACAAFKLGIRDRDIRNILRASNIRNIHELVDKANDEVTINGLSNNIQDREKSELTNMIKQIHSSLYKRDVDRNKTVLTLARENSINRWQQQCHYCKWFGHLIAECRTRQNNNNFQQRQNMNYGRIDYNPRNYNQVYQNYGQGHIESNHN